jgi:misacylated tRNA(Ala) deacylase
MPKDYYPPMHTAEHILNQTMVRKFNCGRAFTMHLEKKKSKCDYHFNRNLTDNEIKEVESGVNMVINSDLPVTEDFITRNEADKNFDLKRLPDTSGEVIRIIKVGDYDACPCIGQHVKSTKEIGEFKILSTSFEENVLRIRFKLNQTK